MRNISRVVLQGLPPTFCALVQRAGRSGRDLTNLGEAILIVPKSVLKDGVTVPEVDDEVANSAVDSEAINREIEDAEITSIVIQELDHEGVQIAPADSSESEEESKNKWKKIYSKDSNINEARALSEYATTKGCRRIVWDKFFGNSQKCMFYLIILTTTIDSLGSTTQISKQNHVPNHYGNTLLR